MQLHDAAIPYTSVPQSAVWRLNTLAEIDCLMQACRHPDQSVQPSATLTPYQRRRWSETVRALQAKEILDADGRLVPLAKDDRVPIPALSYTKLGFKLAEWKTYVSLFSLNKGSKTPFCLTVTTEKLAERAEISRKHSALALKSLAARNLLTAEKRWPHGQEITLLDPQGSGCTIHAMGTAVLKLLCDIPVPHRYSEVFGLGQPLQSGYAPCLYCDGLDKKGGGRKYAVSFTSEPDRWTCHRCNRSGTSVSLWVRHVAFARRKRMEIETGKSFPEIVLEELVEA